MASPGQERRACGHLMAAFDAHSQCTCRHDKGKGNDPAWCTKTVHIVIFWPANGKLKKEKCDSKPDKSIKKEGDDSSSILIDPASVLVLGVVNEKK